MKCVRIAILLTVISVSSQLAYATTGNSSQSRTSAYSVDAARAALQQGVITIQNNDFKAAEPLLQQVVDSEAFAQLTDAEQHAAYLMLGLVFEEEDNHEKALPLLQKASESPIASGIDWHLRLEAAYGISDYGEAAISLATIAEKWPGSLSQVSDQAVAVIVNGAVEHSSDFGFTLMQSLYDARWRPTDEFQSGDYLNLRLARAYLLKGDTSNAIAVMKDVTEPREILEARLEKVFDPVIAADPGQYDVDRALSADLQKMKSLSARMPKRLEGINAVADSLIQQDRAEEALPILDKAISSMAGGAGAQAFSDYGNQRNWTLDAHSRALDALGRYDEAVAEMKKGAGHPENGAENVSQVINLADINDSLERPADALSAVEELNPSTASPYGRMALAVARACAYAQLNEMAKANEQISYMKNHVADGRGPLLASYICTNDLNGAAALIISELGDPNSRSSALYMLQDFLRPKFQTPFDAEYRRRILAVRDRPDVSAALAAVGHIGHYNLLPPGL